MTRSEWQKMLDTYTSVEQVVSESLEGLVEHIDTPCQTDKQRTVVIPGSSGRGLPPFTSEPVFCDRGKRGCGLVHHDFEALVFARMSLDRIAVISEERKDDWESSKR